MAREGIDFSGARPSAAALKGAGKSFVVRYARTIHLPKGITANEVVYWKANGIDIAIVEESTSNRALEGYTAGQEDARLARDAVIVSGGPSNGGAIHFAVDFDTTSDDQRKRIDRYLSGAASILGWPQVGVYGEYEVIDHVVRHLPISFRWQTYAWSHGRVHPMVTLYQYSNGQMLGGVEVDLCRALADNFGQWNWIAPTIPPSTRGDGGIGLA